MNSQNETPNFVNLLDDTYNGYLMETAYANDHNSNPPSRELPDRSPSQVEFTKNPQTRQSNFTIEEDLNLISSYLSISEDPMQSNDQTYKIFWTRVHEYYHTHTTSQIKRTKGSL